MAFRAGLNKPQANQGGNSGKSTQSKIDRLLTVEDYDLTKNEMSASDDKGNKYAIIVDPDTVNKIDASHRKNGTDTSKSPYVGHKIDEKMKKSSPPGSKVIVQKSEVLQRDNGAGQKKTQIQRIFKVPNPEANKTFEAIVSVNYRMDDGKKKLARAYVWEENGIDVNNEAALKVLGEKMDSAAELSGTKMGEFNVSVPTYGFQLRALQLSDKKHVVNGVESDLYVAVDTSIPFDWINGQADESGREIKSQAHTVRSAEMLNFIDQYIEHISSHEAFAGNIDNMKVEVCAYRIYPASNNADLQLTQGDPEKDLHANKNPLYQLAHRQNFVDMENSDDGLITGKNAAVKAIIQLTADRPEKINGKYEEIQTNWVNRIHANNVRGHVHAFVRTEAGQKVEPHDRLKFIDTVQNENRNTGSYSQAAPSAPAPTPAAPVQVATPVAAPVASAEVDDFDPFGSDPAESDTPASEPSAPAGEQRLRFGQRK